MERIEIIQCKDKNILIDYIQKNSNIKVFDTMNIDLLKNIALNILVIQQPATGKTTATGTDKTI
jgi:stage III sporulation protein SpoIIIAA